MLEFNEQSQPGSSHRAGMYGKYRGTVFNALDPLKLGRIQAMVPEVLQGIPTGWAYPCAPVAGLQAGFFAIPPQGSGVWIEFEGGDTSRPIWVGGYWATLEAPNEPPALTPPLPTQKVWRSDTGLTIAMDDTLQTVTISDPLAQNKIEVDVKTASVKITGMGVVVLEAPLVQHGSGTAFHPSVFGDQLMTYLGQLVAAFNSHVHPGELALGFMPVAPALPMPPMMPPTPSLISQKVFVE